MTPATPAKPSIKFTPAEIARLSPEVKASPQVRAVLAAMPKAVTTSPPVTVAPAPANSVRSGWPVGTWGGIVGGTLVLLAVVCVILDIGCETAKTVKPEVSMGIVAQENKAVATDLHARAGQFHADTTAIAAHSTPTAQHILGPFLNHIDSNADGVDVDAGRLDATQPQIEAATKAVVKVEDDNAQLKADKASNLTHLLPWFIALGLLGVVGSGVLFYLSGTTVAFAPLKTVAICLLIGSGIGIVGAILLANFANVIGGVAFAAVLVAFVGTVGFELYKHKAALVQLVKTGEAAKQKLAAVDPIGKTDVFGNGAIPGGVAYELQTPSTQAAVAAIRSTPTFHVATPAAPSANVPPAQPVGAKTAA